MYELEHRPVVVEVPVAVVGVIVDTSNNKRIICVNTILLAIIHPLTYRGYLNHKFKRLS